MDIFCFSSFLEIEGEQNKIINLANLLGFDIKKNITESCDTLYEIYCKKNNLPITDFMVFDDYELLKIKEYKRNLYKKII